MPHCVLHASLCPACLTVSCMPHCVLHASLCPACLIVSCMPHCVLHASLCPACLTVSCMPHCVLHASLCPACLTVSSCSVNCRGREGRTYQYYSDGGFGVVMMLYVFGIYLREVCSFYIFSGGGGDVNECATNNGGCAHICTNTEGSFVCSCRAGFVLAGDGRGCNGEQAYYTHSVLHVSRLTASQCPTCLTVSSCTVNCRGREGREGRGGLINIILMVVLV